MQETGASSKLAFVSTDNPTQNIPRKTKKSSKVRQGKTLITVFTCFLRARVKNVLLLGRMGTRLCPNVNLGFS